MAIICTIRRFIHKPPWALVEDCERPLAVIPPDSERPCSPADAGCRCLSGIYRRARYEKGIVIRDMQRTSQKAYACTVDRDGKRIGIPQTLLAMVCIIIISGCYSAGKHRKQIEGAAAKIIKEKQIAALNREEPFTIENPAETLRRRLLLAQGLPYSGPESLGTGDLVPIEHWPNDDYLSPEDSPPSTVVEWDGEGPLHLTLADALKVAARSSRDYQTRKEDVYRAALRLELERDVFRNTFSGSTEGLFSWDESGDSAVRGAEGSLIGGIARQFKNGIALTTHIGLDVAKLLVGDEQFSKSAYADARHFHSPASRRGRTHRR